MVIFIHRPEVYGFNQDEEGNSMLGMAEIILAKHRNGPIGDVQLKFTKELAKFTDLEENILEPLVDDPTQAIAVTKGSRMNEKLGGIGFDKDDLSKNADYSDEMPF